MTRSTPEVPTRHPHSPSAAATDAGARRQDLAYESVSPAADPPGAQSAWSCALEWATSRERFGCFSRIRRVWCSA
jgi:hypothetical protein